MAPNNDDPEEKKKKQKKYLWFGYGSYSGPGEIGGFNPVNIQADSHIFDRLFEIFGIKEKPKEAADENRN